MREGEWVLLKLSQAAKTRSLGRIVQSTDFWSRWECPRLHPQRLNRVVVNMGSSARSCAGVREAVHREESVRVA